MRVLVPTAALVAAVAVLVGASLPPARLALPAPVDAAVVAGAIHVHTNRSDGLSSVDEVARHAAEAGLQFVVFTDHGDGTRAPDPPTYRSGVLCIDAAEISTSKGHLLALGLPAAPYPLGGEPRDVLDDIHRLGGFGIAAHPDSSKPELAWHDWTAAVDGIEIVNLDSAWRARMGEPGWRPALHLLRSIATYPIRPSETVAALAGDHDELTRQWLAIAQRRDLPVMAGADAHARLALSDDEPRGTGFALGLPSYRAVFGALSTRVRPASPLSGDAAADARLLLGAIRAGHAYVAVDGLAAPAIFAFAARNSTGSADQGGSLPVAGPLMLTVTSNAPDSYSTIVFRDSDVLATQAGGTLEHEADARPGIYRVEIRALDRPGRPIWIASNPIYVRQAPPSPPAARPNRASVRERRALFDAKTPGAWRTEASTTAVIAFDAATVASRTELRVRWGLPGGAVASPYAALVSDVTGGLAGYDRLVFTARGERPMRLSVQVRLAMSADVVERWVRSVYLDATPSAHTVRFDDLISAQPGSGGLDLSKAHSIIFAVDTTNTAPGSSGRFWLSDVAVVR